MIEKITLIGGGLVGSLLSLVLARKGYSVDVYESREDMRKVNISAGRSINLALANRGIKPLQALGLMNEINEMLIPMKGRMVHPEGEPANFQPYGQTTNDVIYSISRGQLNSFLMTKAEATGKVKFFFEHRVSHIDFEKMTFTANVAGTEKSINFNRIIGTDGANSPVRQAILSQESKQDSEAVLDHSYKELTIAPDENGQHKLDANALHIWPRGEFMLIALPNLDGSFTVTLFMPNHGFTSFDSVNTKEEIHHFFDAHFTSIKPLLDDLIGSYQNNPTGRLATIKCSPWHYKDKALIVGDSAHAVVPFHGQGMNCGFEDCNAIAELFPAADNAKDSDWQALFGEVEQVRKINSDAIADMALENYIEMRDSVRQHEFLLQKQFAFKIQQWFPKRFTPRYAMVMFEHRPYSEAFELGKKHKQLLSELSDTYSCPTQLNGDIVKELLDKYQL
ncbi:FAD-dependent monooxygenase [Thalassotalea sp. M1531]|uniref:Kynurenine 3-monooxygenase n=1 Tax=Thalassotalea algicola TaxID=2716224 RepID=A0A7Y0LAP7_9GAMM|nr:NAD(P)/FAD-dependent oxidoreductase [Thalassotalea algicola]NMP31065.1 FAD-dependent monooxygenase [Thalassotalea algicola]